MVCSQINGLVLSYGKEGIALINSPANTNLFKRVCTPLACALVLIFSVSIPALAAGVEEMESLEADSAGPSVEDDVVQLAVSASGKWVKSGDRWWYSYPNGTYATGWKIIDGKKYRFDNHGWMLIGWKVIDGFGTTLDLMVP